ncbi:hypothetical protein [Embleya sp. AB8]|uniref:hypothetical protein n=1 Tax=Embleya sp. AB8 TaxID=3156304 RepID=UPI003C716AC9
MGGRTGGRGTGLRSGADRLAGDGRDRDRVPRGGWLRTGDVGTLRTDGNVVVPGRMSGVLGALAAIAPADVVRVTPARRALGEPQAPGAAGANAG